MVLHHVFHSQVLDGDQLVFSHPLSPQLVKHIFSSVGNLSVNPRYAQSCFVPIVRPFYLAAKGFLSFVQLMDLGLSIDPQAKALR